MGSTLEDLFLFQIRACKLPIPVTEYRFDTVRRWRFDLAYIPIKLAIEIEGGTWLQGRHNRGKGYEADCEKYNNATLAGWRIFRFTGDMVKDGRALKFLESYLSSPLAGQSIDSLLS